jgi:hypothetical protein
LSGQPRSWRGSGSSSPGNKVVPGAEGPYFPRHEHGCMMVGSTREWRIDMATAGGAEPPEPDQWWTEDATASYRRRQRLGPIAFCVAGLLPPSAVILLISNGYWRGVNPPFGLVVPLLLLAVSVVLAVPLGLVASLATTAIAMYGFRCPRCGERVRCAGARSRSGAEPKPPVVRVPRP